MCAAQTAVAQRRDSLTSVQRAAIANDALEEISAGAYNTSVAASAYRRQVNISTLSLRYDMRNEERPMLQAEGSGLHLGRLQVESYMHLNKRSTVEANASYRRGVKQNVCWNSSSDYALLYPYIGADSIGGNLQVEQYAFGGSYAHRGEKFTFGIGADYRALHEFRKVDPRPRNITSDLKINLGGGYNFKEYMLGVSLGARIYNQEHSVDYYSIKGPNTNQLPMTGLGTYYDRFAGSGEVHTDYRFKGFGYSASLQFVPKVAEGWRAMADYSALKINRELPQYNNITLTTLRTQQLSAIVSYSATEDRIRWAVGAEGYYELRRGDENILNVSASSSDMILDTYTMYEGHTINAAITAGVEWMYGWGKVYVRPKVGILSMNAGYRYPERTMSLLAFNGTSDVGAQYQTQKWLADFTIGGGYVASLKSSLFVPAAAEQAIKSMMRRQWQGYSANRVLFSMAASAQRALNDRFSLYLAAKWQMYSRNVGNGHTLVAEFGIKF